MLTVSTQFATSDDFTIFSRMLESVSFADEIRIYVYKNVSSEIITKLRKFPKVTVIQINPVPLVEHIRSRQIQEAKGDWVLITDFDEVVSPALAREIKKVAVSSSPYSVYYLSRRNYSLGYPLTHGGWGDDKILRLFKKVDFLDWPRSIHSTPTYCGEVGELSQYLEHHKDATLSYMVQKTNIYSAAEAKLFYDAKMAPVTPLILLRKTVMEFIRRYFLKLGFLDGKIGLIQSLYQGYSAFLTYAKLYELQTKHHE